MCQLVESIKIHNKKFYNLSYHQERVDRSRKNFLLLSDRLDLQRELYIPSDLPEGLFKCRVVYSDIIHKIEFIPYERKEVKSLQIIRSEEIDYEYKYENREMLNALKKLSAADDIIIVKNGFVTDAFASNLVFSDGTKYFTPSTPLLAGTKRAQLLAEQVIVEEKIQEQEIARFKLVCLINAMLDLKEEHAIPVTNILL